MDPMSVQPKPLKRTGLHRCSCPHGCDTFAYMTVSAIERGPLPLCGECGARLLPDHPELAAKVLGPDDWASHPWLAEFMRACASVDHGQASHVQRGRNVKPRDELAYSRVMDIMRAESRARQLAGLRRPVAPEPMPF